MSRSGHSRSPSYARESTLWRYCSKKVKTSRAMKDCISSKLSHENFRRKHRNSLASVVDVATFDSGLPAGFTAQEFGKTYPRQWFTGDNAPLFHYGANEITTTRPIPDGAYEV